MATRRRSGDPVIESLLSGGIPSISVEEAEAVRQHYSESFPAVARALEAMEQRSPPLVIVDSLRGAALGEMLQAMARAAPPGVILLSAQEARRGALERGAVDSMSYADALNESVDVVLRAVGPPREVQRNRSAAPPSAVSADVPASSRTLPFQVQRGLARQGLLVQTPEEIARASARAAQGSHNHFFDPSYVTSPAWRSPAVLPVIGQLLSGTFSPPRETAAQGDTQLDGEFEGRRDRRRASFTVEEEATVFINPSAVRLAQRVMNEARLQADAQLQFGPPMAVSVEDLELIDASDDSENAGHFVQRRGRELQTPSMGFSMGARVPFTTNTLNRETFAAARDLINNAPLRAGRMSMSREDFEAILGWSSTPSYQEPAASEPVDTSVRRLEGLTATQRGVWGNQRPPWLARHFPQTMPGGKQKKQEMSIDLIITFRGLMCDANRIDGTFHTLPRVTTCLAFWADEVRAARRENDNVEQTPPQRAMSRATRQTLALKATRQRLTDFGDP